MNEYEQEVIEAAIEYVNMLRAYDLGCPAQNAIKLAKAGLVTACENLAAENEGQWIPPV